MEWYRLGLIKRIVNRLIELMIGDFVKFIFIKNVVMVIR